MKITAALLSSALLLGSITVASAQVMTVRQVLTECPDVRSASACPVMATQFLASRPLGAQTDAQIVNLVLALAEAAQQPAVPMNACLNTAEGLRVLAGGVGNAGQAQQILDIADALCENTTTAAINPGAGGGGLSGPFASLSSPVSGGNGNGNTDPVIDAPVIDAPVIDAPVIDAPVPFIPPGFGSLPPGQGGTPPGQTTPPGQGGTPPGQTTPPGQGGTPPGQTS